MCGGDLSSCLVILVVLVVAVFSVMSASHRRIPGGWFVELPRSLRAVHCGFRFIPIMLMSLDSSDKGGSSFVSLPSFAMREGGLGRAFGSLHRNQDS